MHHQSITHHHLPYSSHTQVKKFGRAGQTKYTHLLDQDTTQKGIGSVWMQSEKDRNAGIIGEPKKFGHVLGGTGDINTAGRKSKK